MNNNDFITGEAMTFRLMTTNNPSSRIQEHGSPLLASGSDTCTTFAGDRVIGTQGDGRVRRYCLMTK